MACSKCGSFTVGKGWRRTIGQKVGAEGQLVPCRWWLGFDQTTATSTALKIESLWVGLDAPYWTNEAWAMAEGIRTAATATNAPELTVGASVGALADNPTTAPSIMGKSADGGKILTVLGLIERYRTAYLADARPSAPSKHSTACRTKSLERSPIASMPLASVGVEQLGSLVSFWLARPKTSKGKQISECSSRLIVKTARAVFDHADAVGLWHAPHRFERIFKLSKSMNRPSFKVFSIPELTCLYRHANDRMRLFILLSLNCGFCSAELASLRKDEIDLKGRKISRSRQKTSIPMSWSLWNETTTALAKGMATTSDSELALLTNNGKPIMFYDGRQRRVDIIPNHWRLLLERVNKDRSEDKQIVGSFKLLRKTGATMIRHIGGIEVSEMYLSHSEKSMARFYSTPDNDQLTTALKTMRKQLAPIFKE